MKITWFGEGCFRIHAGGKIVVINPDQAGAEIDRGELISGADEVLSFDEAVRELSETQPDRSLRRRLSPLAQSEETGLKLTAVLGEVLAGDPAGETPFVLVPAEFASWGRFADSAVVILFDEPADLSETLADLFLGSRPKLVLLAFDVPEQFSLGVFAGLAGDTPVQVLDRYLGLET